MKKLICMLLALVMVLAMVACGDENKEAYKAAVAAYNNGEYENAANQLAALGEYKDAASMLATITAEKAGVTTTVTTVEGEVTTTTEYIFKDGNLIKEAITLADGTQVKNYYKYDENGLCTSETLNQADGGKVISHVLTLSDSTTEEATYSYNEQGLLSVISATSGNTTYEYNAFGDVVKEAVEANGEVISAVTYAYIYTFIVSK